MLNVFVLSSLKDKLELTICTLNEFDLILYFSSFNSASGVPGPNSTKTADSELMFICCCLTGGHLCIVYRCHSLYGSVGSFVCLTPHPSSAVGNFDQMGQIILVPGKQVSVSCLLRSSLFWLLLSPLLLTGKIFLTLYWIERGDGSAVRACGRGQFSINVQQLWAIRICLSHWIDLFWDNSLRVQLQQWHMSIARAEQRVLPGGASCSSPLHGLHSGCGKLTGRLLK